MARTPETTIFQGISAIDAAGGIDGFVREVLAESKTLSMLELQANGPRGDGGQCRDLLAEKITDVMLRRLEGDLERGFYERLGPAIAGCQDAKDLYAASERSFDDAKRWSREVVKAVQIEIFGVHLLDEPGAASHV